MKFSKLVGMDLCVLILVVGWILVVGALMEAVALAENYFLQFMWVKSYFAKNFEVMEDCKMQLVIYCTVIVLVHNDHLRQMVLAKFMAYINSGGDHL